MELFWSVLADVIHFLAILVVNRNFFLCQKREIKYRQFKILIACLGIGLTSFVIYLCDNHIFETFLYVSVVIVILYILYKKALGNVIIVTLWILFVLSMIDTMIFALFDSLMLILHLDLKNAVNFMTSLVSLMFVWGVGKIYRKKVSITLNNIGYTNLIGYTVLLIVDTFVIAGIVKQPFINSYAFDNRNLYLWAVICVIIGIFIQLAAVIILLAQRNVHKEKEQILNAYLNEQKNHYEYLENREKETKKFRHDLRNHMDMITNLAQNQAYDRIGNYLEQMNMKIDTFGTVVTVHNGIVDAIISQYYVKAKQNGVDIKVEGKFPVDCTIDAYDLCTIFSNILSNAYEAAMESEDKFISLVCGYTERNIIIVIKNSCNGEPPAGGIMWKTRKANADYHGYGLENVKDSVKKYNGIFDIEINGKMCTLKILFKHKEEQTCVKMEMSDENSNCG